MKKKMVIVTRRMIMGGIEKALISMLNAIPKDKYDITVLVMGSGGELEEEIPKHIKFECIFGYEKTTVEKIMNAAKRGRFLKAFKIGWYTLLSKRARNTFEQELYLAKTIQRISTEFDLAIAYHTPASFPVMFVMKYIRAKTKIAWIHSDVSEYVRDLKPYREFYDKYDKIFCVSTFAMKKLNEQFPHLSKKTSVFYNILDINQIKSLAEKRVGFEDQFTGFRILTIGRLTKEKGQDIIPNVVKKLREEGNNVRWYCIGDGECRHNLEDMIQKNGLNEHLILLGTSQNPYPYLRQCDIYVQPSRHEGYCISLAEARAFNKPIITTNTVGAREQIKNGMNGIIVNFNENEMYVAIKKLIKNQNLCATFEKNLKQTSNNTSSQIKKLFDSVG